ncbi:MAG: NAD(P)/FAD-dependent oxidoreductase [Polyangiaceae bacterium]
MSETNVDVVVIGGGPAGSVAAARCARAGLSVVLLESCQLPRDRPGESLHPGAETVLRELGAWEQVAALQPLRHAGIWLNWAAPETFQAFGADADGAWRGVQVWRADLDSILLEGARRAGAVVLQSVAVREVLQSEGVVVGVETPTQRILARSVIDASGGRHWLAHKLGVAVQRVSRPLIARYGYVRHLPGVDEAPRLSAEARGWTWTARVRDDTYAWTSLATTGSVRDELRPAGLKPFEFGRVRSADVTWRIASRCAGPGYWLAGDAAFVLDPSSSHGVLRALLSGAQAAEAVVRTLGNPALEPEIALGYDQALRSWFAHDVERLSALYAQAFPGWRTLQPD